MCEKLFADMGRLLDKGAFSPSLVALLMQKYCSFLPHELMVNDDATDYWPDVPLFDHLKLTAAFGACLYGYVISQKATVDGVTGQYLYVMGDLSGVQKFVYTISSRGALKTLRARSFFLELLTLHVVQLIVERCGGSPINILYATGGLFSVLVPKTEKIETLLKEIREDVNSYLANIHDSRVYLAMEYTDLSHPFQDSDFLARDNFGYFTTKVKRTYQKLRNAKQQRFFDKIGSNISQIEKYLGPFLPTCKTDVKQLSVGAARCVRCGKPSPEPISLKIQIKGRLDDTLYIIHGCKECLESVIDNPQSGECSVCHKESAFLLTLPEPSQSTDEKEPVSACLFCNLLYHLGEHLPMAASSVIVRKTAPPSYEESKAFLFIGDYYYYLKTRPDETDVGTDKYIWGINQIDPLELLELCGESMINHISTFMMARHQPWRYVENHPRPLDFAALADESVGADKLGVLKMDVDNLGDVFTSGLRREGEEVIPLARRISLSRQMELFLKFYIDEICYGHYGAGLEKPRPEFSNFVPAPEKPSNWQWDRKWGSKGRNVVIVYSGGDDLFLVGAWSDATEIAFDLHRSFKAYTAENPEIDISAGLVLTAKNYPLYHMANLAKKAINKAKECTGKASVSLFYTPQGSYPFCVKGAVPNAIKWEKTRNVTDWVTANDVLELIELFKTFKQNDAATESDRWQLKLSHSFVRDLFRIVDVYRRSGKLYLPRLAYLLAKPRSAPGTQISRDQWNQLSDKLRHLNTITYLPFALTWVDLLCREKGNRG